MVVGTQALRDPDWFARMAELFPGRLLLGLDARDGKVATQGWIDVSSIQALAFARQFDSLPIAGIIYTDIERDGMLGGPNLESIAALAGVSQDPGDRFREGSESFPILNSWLRFPFRVHRGARIV